MATNEIIGGMKQGLVDMFKDDDDYQDNLHAKQEELVNPFARLEKAYVLQEARIFHDSKLVKEKPAKCGAVLAMLLYLQQDRKNHLTPTEATEVFFAVTKLFVSSDAALRRMLYLFIREVYEAIDHNDVIIVTSSLTKDMTSAIDLYRANSLRVLSCIIDSSMLGAIERYVKQAIVDSSPLVASSALVSAIRLFNSSPDCASIIRKWIAETQNALTSKNHMVQFHAMQLLYQIRAHDRLAVSKIVQQFSEKSLKSPLAVVCLVRYASKLLRDEITGGRTTSISNGSSLSRMVFTFLLSSLKHANDMVRYEAARAICGFPSLETQELSPAISVLKLMLSNIRPSVKYAAVKTLAYVATYHPRLVSSCNEELEALLNGDSTHVGTQALTTLLKTSGEDSVVRLLRRASAFLPRVDDEHKIVVVRNIQQLCFTYPNKHQTLVNFLSMFLTDVGGFEFKRAIVKTITSLVRAVPESADSSLMNLCEFIEDCEFDTLLTQILHLLGEVGPSTSHPSRYIRFIYNRIILENSTIRAAAVLALARFGAQVPSLRSSILTLLRHSLSDENDETRDRAAVAVAVLSEAMEVNPYVPPDEDAEEIPPDVPVPDDTAAYVFRAHMPMCFDNLERSLKSYMGTPGAMASPEVLTFASLPVVESEAEDTADAEADDGTDMATDLISTNGSMVKPKADPAAVIYAIPELASLGRVFRSCAPVELTESETEYVVECIKHIFENHIVLQFNVSNTIEDQKLTNVTVAIDPNASGHDIYKATGEISASAILCGEHKNCFTVLERDISKILAAESCSCELRFSPIQIDPPTGEEIGEASYEEEYPLEDLLISPFDFMAKVAVPDFRDAWKGLGGDDGSEVLEKYALHFENMQDAVTAVVEMLGMQPCDGTSHVKEDGKPHMLHLSGVFVGGRSVLVRAQISMNWGGKGGNAILKLAVRSQDATISRIVADGIS